MFETILNYSVLALYVAGMAVIAIISRKKSKTVNDFLLAGRGVGGWMSAFAYGTTYFSAVIFVGYAGTLGAKYGLGTLWIGIGNALVGSLLAWLVLAKRTRKITHALNAKTMPEFFERRYNCPYAKLFSAILIFVCLIPYSASVYTGLGKLFEIVFGIDLWLVVLIMAVITALYVFFGGYYATTISDFVQGIIMLVGVVIMIAFVYNYETVGNIADGIGKLINDELGLFPKTDFAGVYTLISLVVLTSLGTWGAPQVIQKFASIKNEGAIKKATWVSTAFCFVIGAGAYFIGCVARYVVPSAQGEMIMPELLKKALPAGLLGLIAILVLSASMSSLSSLTLSSSSSVAIDIYKGYIKKDAPDKKVNLLLRILCIVFIAISGVLAIFPISGIINMMSLSWGILAGCFIGPYVFGLYSKRVGKWSFYASMISGVVLTIVLYTISLTVKSMAVWFAPPAIGTICMIVSLAITPLVALFTKPAPEQTVKLVFDAVNSQISQKEQIDALELQETQEQGGALDLQESQEQGDKMEADSKTE